MENAEHVIIVLGHKNNPHNLEEVSPIAKMRIDLAIEIQKKEGGLLLFTGGKSELQHVPGHLPHAAYGKRYALEQGVAEEDVAHEFAVSVHTGEDAAKAKEIVDGLGVKRVTVVTSDFHVYRSELTMQEVFGDEIDLAVKGADSNLNPTQYKQMFETEARKIKEYLGIDVTVEDVAGHAPIRYGRVYGDRGTSQGSGGVGRG